MKAHPHWVVADQMVSLPIVLVIVVVIADFTVLVPGKLYAQHLQHS